MESCKKCKLEFEIAQLRQRGLKSGKIYYICSKCFEYEQARQLSWESQNKDKIKQRKRLEYAQEKNKDISEIKKYGEALETGFKICNRCKEKKEISSFFVRIFPSGNTGLHYVCIPCYEETHPPKRVLLDWDVRKRIKSEKSLSHYYQNREAILARKKLDRQNNPEKYKAQALKRRNSPVYAEWKQKNKHSLKEKYRQYWFGRRIADPAYKLRKNVSKSIHDALESAGFSKRGFSIMEKLPYSIEKLKKHLELQFEEWMNWDNWGTYVASLWKDDDSNTWVWHIDHIVPQSDLPYDSMDHPNFLKCWALENLRPLSAKQNILDGVTRARHQRCA